MLVQRSNDASQSSTVKVDLLSDGVSFWDGGGAFGLVPRDRWSKMLPPDDHNRVPQELRCVLVRTGGHNILIDCGVGTKPNDMLAAQYEVRRPNGHLLDDLARHNLQPSEIDIVIFTHLHGDHSGWATEVIDEGKVRRYRPTFPNAHYYVQAQEYEDATHTNERTRNTYFAENFVPLHEAGMLTLLDGPADITPSVRVVPTPGHTAGHQSVIVQRSKGAREQGSVGDAKDAPLLPLLPGSPAPLLILGDLATYMIQFARLAWVTAYDVLPLQTIETKRYWQKWALEEHAVLISPHDTLLPTGVLQKDNKGFLQVVPDSNG